MRFKYLISLIFLLAFNSCSENADVATDNGGVEATLRLSLGKENFYDVDTRAPKSGMSGTTRVAYPAESVIRSIAIWVFTEDGSTLLTKYFKTYAEDNHDELSVDIPVNLSSPNIQVYVIANADNSAISGLNTITGIINTVPTTDNADIFLMSGHGTYTSSQTSYDFARRYIYVDVPLTRVVSKVTLNLEAGGAMRILSYQLCNVPTGEYVFENEDYVKTLTDKAQVADIVTTTDTVALYCFANPATAVGDATYVVVRAEDTTSGDIYRYTVYPAINDGYTMERNHNYICNIKIKGANTADSHITKE